MTPLTWTLATDDRERAGDVAALTAYCQVAIAVGCLPLGDDLSGGVVVIERGCIRNGTAGAAGECGGHGPARRQAAASSAITVAQRSWNTRRRSPSDTTWPDRVTGRKYWRCSSKPEQQCEAEAKRPKPRIG
jgi:hypothetical protein